MIDYLHAIKSNKLIYKFTQEAISDNLTHAYIIVARDSVSLSEILKAMSEIILCESNCACGECSACIRINHNNHTNVHYYGKDTKDIKVAAIEDLISTTYKTPLENGKSVYIIDGAEKMNEHSQNKLLKTLEEPQPECILLLGTTNENALLSTIRSRAKQLYINIWDNQTIRAALLKQYGGNSAEDRIDFASEMACGSIERALELMDNEEYYNRFNSLISMLTTLANSSQIVNYLGLLGNDRETVGLSLSMLEVIFNTALKSSIDNSPNAIAAIYPPRAIVNIQELIIEQYQKLKANCLIGSVEDALFMGMLEIKYKTA